MKREPKSPARRIPCLALLVLEVLSAVEILVTPSLPADLVATLRPIFAVAVALGRHATGSGPALRIALVLGCLARPRVTSRVRVFEPVATSVGLARLETASFPRNSLKRIVRLAR